MNNFKKRDEDEIEDELREWFSGARRVVVAGIGNSLRRDDFVGVKIVRNLRNRTSQAVYLIECETVPESFLKPILEFKPTHILIIDAALLSLKPGSSRLIEPAQLPDQPLTSTHALPLQIFYEYLARATGAEIALLAIQPKDGGFGEGLTAALEKTAKHLTCFLSKVLP